METLEERRVLSATTNWIAPELLGSVSDVLSPTDISDSNVSDNGGPIADPAVLVSSGDPNTDAASLLAAGGPGDPSLPGFANVSRSGDNGTVVYLGNGWALTASHVVLTNTINFGGTWYAVDTSSVVQLHNSDASHTDLKMFRVLADPLTKLLPALPDLLNTYIASEPPSGHVFMVGNGLTVGQEKFWSVDKSQTPWAWTEISAPTRPNSNNFSGVSFSGPRTIRWGENAVQDSELYLQVGSYHVSGFTTQFDSLKYTNQSGLENEAQASAGDSGGAVFSFVDGKWVLSGIMLAVNGSLSGQPGNTSLYGGFTFIADVSAYRDEILSIVGVVDRQIFYDGSKFDLAPGVDANDDNAIATDKTAYQAGDGLATMANVTSYTQGINGIMIDLASTHGTLTADDFTFKIGKTSVVDATWIDAPLPLSVTVRSGEGEGGTDRVELIWSSSAIKNTWLEVTVKGNDSLGGFNTNTGLRTSDVFYFGNRQGDGGTNPSKVALTNAADEIAARGNTSSHIPITNPYDFNRDGLINAGDEIAARLNTGALLMLNMPSTVTAQAASQADVQPSTAPVEVGLPVVQRDADTLLNLLHDDLKRITARSIALDTIRGNVLAQLSELSFTAPTKPANSGWEMLARHSSFNDTAWLSDIVLRQSKRGR